MKAVSNLAIFLVTTFSLVKSFEIFKSQEILGNKEKIWKIIQRLLPNFSTNNGDSHYKSDLIKRFRIQIHQAKLISQKNTYKVLRFFNHKNTLSNSFMPTEMLFLLKSKYSKFWRYMNESSDRLRIWLLLRLLQHEERRIKIISCTFLY